MIRITWEEYNAICKLYGRNARCYTYAITSTKTHVFVDGGGGMFNVSHQYICQQAKIHPKDYAVVRKFFGAKLG